MKSLFLVPWSRFVFLEPSTPPASERARSSPARCVLAPTAAPGLETVALEPLPADAAPRPLSLQRRPPAAREPGASAACGAGAGGGSYKRKDVIVDCKALCKIHIYRIIKSVQAQAACASLRPWNGGDIAVPGASRLLDRMTR